MLTLAALGALAFALFAGGGKPAAKKTEPEPKPATSPSAAPAAPEEVAQAAAKVAAAATTAVGVGKAVFTGITIVGTAVGGLATVMLAYVVVIVASIIFRAVSWPAMEWRAARALLLDPTASGFAARLARQIVEQAAIEVLAPKGWGRVVYRDPAFDTRAGGGGVANLGDIVVMIPPGVKPPAYERGALYDWLAWFRSGASHVGVDDFARDSATVLRGIEAAARAGSLNAARAYCLAVDPLGMFPAWGVVSAPYAPSPVAGLPATEDSRASAASDAAFAAAMGETWRRAHRWALREGGEHLAKGVDLPGKLADALGAMGEHVERDGRVLVIRGHKVEVPA